MRLILRIILLAGISFFASSVMPWWNIVLVGFLIAALIPGNAFGCFVSGFLGGGILWLGYAWKVDTETDSIMSTKIVELIPMINDVTSLLILSAIIGGIAAGFGMLAGNSFRRIFQKKKTSGLYHS